VATGSYRHETGSRDPRSRAPQKSSPRSSGSWRPSAARADGESLGNHRPRIAITTSQRKGSEYYAPYRRAVEAAGAEPVDLLPGTATLPEQIDGLLLPGGWDVDPSLYGEKKGEDGTVEGVESDDGLIVAVQCHPEELTTALPWARHLSERFVARARGEK